MCGLAPFAGDHDYTLTVENGGGKSQLDVTIKTSKAWKANPVDFVLAKGEMLPVRCMDDQVEAY